MKRIAGLSVATGLLTIAFHSAAEPPSRSAASDGAQAEHLDHGEAQEPRKLAPSVITEDAAARMLFEIADRNHDGSVSYDEFVTVVQESIARRVAVRFRQLDRNHDGRCSLSEVNKMSAARFARFDLNHDGYFTYGELHRVMTQEVATHLYGVYARLDRDHDGRLSLAELTPQPRQSAPAAVAQHENRAGSKTTQVAKRDPPSIQ